MVMSEQDQDPGMDRLGSLEYRLAQLVDNMGVPEEETARCRAVLSPATQRVGRRPMLIYVEDDDVSVIEARWLLGECVYNITFRPGFVSLYVFDRKGEAILRDLDLEDDKARDLLVEMLSEVSP